MQLEKQDIFVWHQESCTWWCVTSQLVKGTVLLAGEHMLWFLLCCWLHLLDFFSLFLPIPHIFNCYVIMMKLNEMCFHPNKDLEVSEFMPAEGSMLWPQEQSFFKLCIISTGLHLWFGLEDISAVQDSATLSHPPVLHIHVPVPGCCSQPCCCRSPVLQQLPEAGTTGQLLDTSRKGFCKFAII